MVPVRIKGERNAFAEVLVTLLIGCVPSVAMAGLVIWRNDAVQEADNKARDRAMEATAQDIREIKAEIKSLSAMIHEMRGKMDKP